MDSQDSFGQSYSDVNDSGGGWKFPFGTPDASTGITMVSPPGSPSTSDAFYDCNDDEMIDNQGGKTVSADTRRAVDLEKETDLEFSEGEVDSSRKMNSTSNPDGTKKERVLPSRPLDFEAELPSLSNGKAEDGEKAHEEPNVNETGTVHSDTNASRLNDNFRKTKLQDDEMIDNQGGKTVSADPRRAVDLGKDTDLGFSEEEVDLARKIKSTSNPDGTKKERVLPSRPLDFEAELPSLSNGKAEDGEKAHEEPNVNETGTVHSDTNASRLNDNFRKTKLQDDEMIDNQGGKTVSSDPRRAVDLGKDTDLGFSAEEVDLARKIKSTSNPDGTKKERVLPSRPLDFEAELPSLSNGKAEDGEKAHEEPNVNETGTVHSDTNASRLNDNFRKTKLLDDEMIDNHSGKTVSADTRRAVDLGKDTDLGFSEEEVDLARKIKSTSNPDGTKKKRVLPSQPLDFDTELPLLSKGKALDGEKADEEPNVNETGTVHLDTNASRLNDNFRKIKLLDDEMIDNHSGRTVSADSRRAVDLGKDTDSGFSEEEVDSAKKIKSTSNPDGTKKKLVLPSQPLDFETELPSLSKGKAEDGEKADEEPNVNETGTVHSDTNASGLNDNFRKIELLDVLLKLERDSEEDESLACLSLLEVAERKWGKF